MSTTVLFENGTETGKLHAPRYYGDELSGVRHGHDPFYFADQVLRGRPTDHRLLTEWGAYNNRWHPIDPELEALIKRFELNKRGVS